MSAIDEHAWTIAELLAEMQKLNEEDLRQVISWLDDAIATGRAEIDQLEALHAEPSS